MYVYTMQAMPGCKAQFDGDTATKYQVKRTHTAAASKDKNRTAVIRTGMDYTEATALVKIFNDKERESLAIKRNDDARLTQNA